jgi:preprotein translocase subunit SecA
LNAKNHEREADIVAQAGRLGQVTIATNMAGRGTDILLGGNPEYMATQQLKKENFTDEQIYNATSYQESTDPEILGLRGKFKELYERFKEQTDDEKVKVTELGGLHIIGTERHDSRRIDNQLRGRAGRQGDPGSTIFYISCEDDIMKRFGKDVIGASLRFFKMDDIQSRMLTRVFERVQKSVEGFYFDDRRYTFEYDNVLNGPRELIYKERNRILDGEDTHKQIVGMFPEVIARIVREAINIDNTWEEWDLERANEVLGSRLFGKKIEYLTKENTQGADYAEVEQMVLDAAIEQYEEKVATTSKDGMDFSEIERGFLLSVVDQKWMMHIDEMVHLRQGIGLRSYGQRDPLIEYRREAIEMFNNMVESINETAVLFLFKIERRAEKPKEMPFRKAAIDPVAVTRNSVPLGVLAGSPLANQGQVVSNGANTGSFVNSHKTVGRNEPCPCGSGKKFKSCCGREES